MTSSIHEEAIKKAKSLSCFRPDAGHIERYDGVAQRKSPEEDDASFDGDVA